MKKNLSVLAFICLLCFSGFAQQKPSDILLKNYRPKSIYHIPVTIPDRAKYPVIDMHSHPYANNAQEVDQWVKTMYEFAISRSKLNGLNGNAVRLGLNIMDSGWSDFGYLPDKGSEGFLLNMDEQ